MIPAHERMGGQYLLRCLVHHVASQEGFKLRPKHQGQGCALCATQAVLEQASWHCAAMYAANRGAVGRAHKSRLSLILSGSTIIGCKTGCPMKAYCLHAATKTGNLILSALSRHVH